MSRTRVRESVLLCLSTYEQFMNERVSHKIVTNNKNKKVEIILKKIKQQQTEYKRIVIRFFFCCLVQSKFLIGILFDF